MNQLYSRQLGFLIFNYLLGSALIFVPEKIAGRDLWIVTILGSLIGLYLLYLLISIQELYPENNIMQVAELSLGKLAGKLLNLAFLWGLFMIAILLLFDIMIFVEFIFPNTSPILLTAIIILTSSYALLKGLTIGGRLIDLFIWPTLIALIVGFPILFTLFDFQNTLPLLTNIKPVLGATIYSANWPFAEIIVIAFYLPFVIDLKENKQKLYIWFGLATLVLVIRAILAIGVLGVKHLTVSHFPFYDVIRLLKFQEFQRLELFFFMLFMTLAFTTIFMSYRAFNSGLQQFFGFKDPNLLLFPVGLLLLALMFNTFPSDIKFLATQANSVIFLALPFHVLYPTIVFIAAKVKSKGLGVRREA